MALGKRFFARMGSLFRNRRAERELAREVESHLALLADDFERRGMSPKEARLAAKRAYGGVEQAMQAHRDERSLLWMEQAMQDVRYALRMLKKSPGFAAVTILTLALGIGANTAIFSVINAVMFRALPVADPQHLVIFSWTAHHRPKHLSSSSYGDCAGDCFLSMPYFNALRAQTTLFSSVAAFAGPPQIDLSDNGPASIADGQYVSGDYFNLLGLKTVFGRPLGPADDTPSAPPAIVLDYRYWQRAFGADPAAVGRTVRLNNVEAMIVGVADPRFTGLTPGKTQDFFMPLSLVKRVRSQWWSKTEDRLGNPNIWWVVMVGRLKPGVTVAQAQSQATTLFRNATLHGGRPMFAEADAPTITLLPAREGLNGESNEIAPMLKLIMAAVGFVLLIACANVAGLILARSTKRQKEIAVRQALGARRARIARQLLTESLLLSVAGGALGIVVAFWGVDGLTRLLSSGFDESFPFVIATDWRVLAFTGGVTIATGILAGLAPTLSTARLDLTPALHENASSLPGESTRSGRGFRLGDLLVVAQVALSIVVLIGAGLLVRTLRNLESLRPGFDTHNILLFAINPTIAGYKDRQTDDLYRDLQQRFAAMPGVLSVSYSEEALLSDGRSSTDVHLDGAPPKSNLDTDLLPVGLDFFSAMRIPLRGGRSFTSADFATASDTHAAIAAADELASKARIAGSAPVTAAAPVVASAAKLSGPPAAPVPVIVNQTFVRKYLSGRDPLGLHMGNAEGDEPPTGPRPGYRIVGIAADSKYYSLRQEIEPTMYSPLVGNQANFALRTAADPTGLVGPVRQIVARADSNLPLFDIRTQTEQIDKTLYQERLVSQLSSIFALLALLLASIGLYGLLSYEVARRTRELGIRIALGARRRELMRLVVRRGLLLAIAGAVVGIGAAMAATRLMAAMLYGVRPFDPATFAGVSILLVLVALAACSIPARRAMRIDPMVALRDE